MTDETIHSIIYRLNTGELYSQAFICQLKDNVFFGIVWSKLPEGKCVGECGDNMFFVKDGTNQFVAAVLDMGINDLHIYVVPEHRKKGYMTKALKDVVLPYFRSTGRSVQKVTFKSPEIANYVERLGFKLVSDSSASIALRSLPIVDIAKTEYLKLEEHRIESLKQRVRQAAGLLKISRDELYAVGQKKTADKLNKFAKKLDDMASDFTWQP